MEEKVIIVGVETEANQRYFSESMEELVQLTNTASGEVVFTITQRDHKWIGKRLSVREITRISSTSGCA